jgi:glycine cleavage system H lipoate-binding protein
MAVIEKFLGQRVSIPDELRYDIKQGLWAKTDGVDVIIGLSEPALVLHGGVNDLDWLVSEGEFVRQNQDVVFAITGKILYISTPFAGCISLNAEAKQRPECLKEDPYRSGWLFRLPIDAGQQSALYRLADADAYMARLRESDGCKNPEGLKGGVSGICKAVYSGIREQKMTNS